MIKPVIHLNGTSKEALAKQYDDAVKVLRGAIQAVEDTAPNARDYFVFGVSGYPQAVTEHIERLGKLRSVLKELTDLREHCADS